MSHEEYTKAELEKLKDHTDYDRLKKMSEEEIEAKSWEDPDSLSPTEEQLKKFGKVKNEKVT